MQKTEDETIEGMVTWKFKCLACGYRFKAIEPRNLCDSYNKCAMCGSREFDKKVIMGGKGNGEKSNTG